MSTCFVNFYTLMLSFTTLYIYWLHFNILISPLITLPSLSSTLDDIHQNLLYRRRPSFIGG